MLAAMTRLGAPATLQRETREALRGTGDGRPLRHLAEIHAWVSEYNLGVRGTMDSVVLQGSPHYDEHRDTMRDLKVMLQRHNTALLKELGGWGVGGCPSLLSATTTASRGTGDTAAAAAGAGSGASAAHAATRGSGAAAALGKLRRDDLSVRDRSGPRIGFALHDVLSPDECRAIIDTAESVGFLPLVTALTRSQRSNCRVMVTDPEFSTWLWSMLAPVLPATYHTSEGDWVLYGINPTHRVCRYLTEQHFGAHTDDRYRAADNSLASMYTIVMYLNDDYEGGKLRFLKFESHTKGAPGGGGGGGGDDDYVVAATGGRDDDDGSVIATLTPKRGMVTIFDQNLLHEGQTLTSGVKYLLRTDVIYRQRSVAARACKLT